MVILFWGGFNTVENVFRNQDKINNIILIKVILGCRVLKLNKLTAPSLFFRIFNEKKVFVFLVLFYLFINIFPNA